MNPNIQAISTCIETGTPVLIEGSPGGGKTAIMNSIARSLHRPFVALIAALHEPSDFNGWPVVHDGAMRFVPPEWAKFCLENPNTIVFFDEITTTPPAVQASLLRVIHEGVVGATKLPVTTSFVAACNPPEQAPGGWELSLPLANRFVHLSWVPRLDEWADGVISGFQPPVLKHIPADWPESVPSANSLIVSFLKARPHFFLNVPQQGQGKAWPSPRMWTTAGKLLGACHALGFKFDHEVTGLLMAGAVGTGAAIELLNYLQNLDLPDPEAVLAHPERTVFPERGDQLYAVLRSVVTAVVQNNTPERWLAGWNVLARAAKDKPDVACMNARTLAKNCPKQGMTVPIDAHVFTDILRQAGILQSR